jgi:hypothetical protein
MVLWIRTHESTFKQPTQPTHARGPGSDKSTEWNRVMGRLFWNQYQGNDLTRCSSHKQPHPSNGWLGVPQVVLVDVIVVQRIRPCAKCTTRPKNGVRDKADGGHATPKTQQTTDREGNKNSTVRYYSSAPLTSVDVYQSLIALASLTHVLSYESYHRCAIHDFP